MSSNNQLSVNAPPPPALSNLQMFLTITAVTGVTLLSTLLTGLLTVSIPTIASQLGISEGAMQWPVSMNSLVNGAFLLVAGGLADTLGRKTLFLVGTSLFSIIGLGVSFAKTSSSFIVLMAFLGLAPAILSPAGAGILGAKLPSGRIKTIGFASLGAGQPIGFITGLVVGGALSTRWHIMFWVLSGASAALGVLAFFALPPDVRLTRHEMWSQIKAFDWVGSLLSTGAAISFIFALSDAGVAPQGWSTPYIPALLPTSTTLIISFLWWEEKRQQWGQHVLLPLSIWRAKGLPTLIAVVFFSWAAFNSMFYLSTLMFQQVQMLSPIRTAIYFLPSTASGFTLNVLAGHLTGRLSTLQLIAIGQLLSIAANIVFATLNPDNNYFLGLFWTELLATGPDIFFPAANLHIQNSVGEDQQALAGSLFMIATRWSTSFGLSICSTIATSVSTNYQYAHPAAASKEALLEGLRAAGWACFASSSLSLLIAAYGFRGTTVKNETGPSVPTPTDEAPGEPIPLVELRSSATPTTTKGSVRSRVAGIDHTTRLENGEQPGNL